MDFLKTALAPPDFSIGTFDGIPDSFDGRVVTKSWNSVQNMPTLTDNLPTYIVQLPIPGVAYLYGQLSVGALVLTPVYYTDFTSLFPSGYENTNVTNFRYAGQAFEIIPMNNAMTWSGSVQVFRGPVQITMSGSTASSAGLTLGGLSSLVNSAKPETVHPFNMGCFCIARQTQQDFPFHPIYPGTTETEISIYGSSGGAVNVTIAGSGSVVGCGSMEAIIYKLPTFTNASNIFTIRTWAFTEFQVNSNSSLYEYSHISPQHDALAMALVKRAFNELKVCVPFYENDGFWNKVLMFIKTATEALSYAPGPIGDLALGTNLAATAIEALVF